MQAKSQKKSLSLAHILITPAAIIPSDSDGGAGGGGSDSDEAEARADTADIKGDRPDPLLAIRLARPTKPSPLAEMFYGYMLLYSGGYQTSSAFFCRAYAVQPTDPLLSLATAVAFLSRATNRQTDNRHHMILTATTFLQKYLKCRSAAEKKEEEGLHWAEIEYNRGRAMHHVGLVHLAERHYRAVLERGREEKGKGWDMKREAAWNLALIYTTSGSPGLVQGLYDQYLRV